MMRLLRFLKPHRWTITLVCVLIFLQSLSTLYLPTLMSNIVDTGIVQGNIPYILRVGGLMLLVSIAGVGCSVTASYFSSGVSAKFGRVLRSQVFERAERFTLHEFDELGTSSLITRTTNDITQVQQLVNMMLRLMVMAPLTAIGGIIMAVSTNAQLSLVILVVMPILAIAIFAIFRRSIPLFRVMQQKIDRLNQVLRENLIGVRVVRSFDRVDYEIGRFDTANFDLTNTATKVNQRMASLQPVMMIIINLATVAILWFGSIRINAGAMQVGNLMAFIQYVMQILFAVMMVSMMSFMFPRASASAARINEVLDLTPAIHDRDAPTPVGPPTKRGWVEFEAVTFRYPGAEQPAVSDLSFAARPGEVTAIIGGTGAGKSTLVSLIPRFYDVDGGRVLVDGVDVREMPQHDLRARIGLVPQQTVLFSGTVADNIRYGKEDATQAEIEKAAEIAQAADFIKALPNGYDTVIAQGGLNLSGGQKQRLSIARALVRRPEIFIFDDSFSALDLKTDARLRAALQSEIKGATTLIVAQRISTVLDADQIIVLDEGRIAGIGRHRELLATCEVYREIVASQLGEGALA
ncbi:ABC transporter ATP-binding protein [Alicyclobacillus cycloheptanicus]|uniref:ATP-binding cassette subfamily B protein n=1 Tax=Alicyclobacillus cycloheptanicus TaxID=1457 RepID=A0ABT9XEW5_9BACL|nr:ABC transporter ATP-binding protein [Alicyclobacillus cycloheptanicus]MDQ0188843.1 ATP-binding cassette subfamily B protein [Alicyclobacillus cycloheptanicus]WDM00511.1 ABC transporter ATP-binding protein [Alicyclobacillus cycloheptanicus]